MKLRVAIKVNKRLWADFDAGRLPRYTRGQETACLRVLRRAWKRYEIRKGGSRADAV